MRPARATVQEILDMQFINDLPQSTRIGVGLAVLLLLTLLVVMLVRRRAAAGKPADEASRKERKRGRTRRADAAAQKVPRRKRRKLAAEAAHAGAQALVPGEDIEIEAAPPAVAPTDAEPIDDDTSAAAIASAAAALEAAREDPYLMSAMAESPQTDAAVAQPGWPSPGELASGFDPDVFDPLPPADDAHDAGDPIPYEAFEDDHVDEVALRPATDDEALNEDTQVIPAADADAWAEDEEFDPATGWIDDDESAMASAQIWGDAPADDEEPPVPSPTSEDDESAYLEIDTAPAAQGWDEDETIEALTLDEGLSLDELEQDPVLSLGDEDELALETLGPDPVLSLDDEDAVPLEITGGEAEPALPGDDTVAEAPIEWPTEDWADDADEQGDLAVPFPAPGTLPEHEATVADVLTTDTPGVPAVTGRIDTGNGAPVVIDLANLVANGERVEVVIENDENGVRLRFSPSPETATPQHVEEAAAPSGEDRDVPEFVDGVDLAAAATTDDLPAASVDDGDDHDGASQETTSGRSDIVDVSFLTGPPPSEASLSPWEPVDTADTPAHDDPVEPPVADDVTVRVGADATSDDPAQILADIRARLAALDARRFGGDN